MTIQANQGFGVSVFGAVSSGGGGGGGGTPGGLDTQVQFNSSGSFGASAAFTFVSPALTIGTQQTTQGQIVFANTAAGAFATTVQSSNSASAAWTLTLPATAGTANYALTTNGSGVSSWSQISLTAGVTGTLPLANGGTNANLTASNGGIVYSDASAFAVLAGTATAGQILRSGASGAPSWSTATYPTTTTANQLLYSSATNTVGGLASANTSALVTNSSGVPSFTSGGTANRVLRTDGTTVSFAQVGLTTDVTGVLPVANGGTNASSASITAFNNITGYTATGATGTTSTNLVFSTSPNITTPTFTTSATGPLFIGGTGTTSTLTLRSTSGVGTTGADIIFQTGNNGATEAMRILNSGNASFGSGTFLFNNATRQFIVTTSASFAPQVQIVNQANDASAGYSLFVKSRAASGAAAAVQVGDAIGTFLFTGSDSDGVVRNSAYVEARVTAVASGSVSGRMDFVCNGSTSDIRFSPNGERMRITGAGTVNIVGGGTAGTSQAISFNGGAPINSLVIDASGNILVGTATSPTTGTQCLTIETGTAPTDSPADTVTFYSTDLSAGNTIPSIYTEGTGIVSVNTGTTNLSNRIAVRVNGTVYYLLAASSA
jgi:hypothetical protein